MNSFFKATLLTSGAVCCVALLASCNIQFRNKHYTPTKKEKTHEGDKGYWEQARVVKVGAVTFVDDKGFVLLENKKNLALPVGQRLRAEGYNGRTTLIVTAERTHTHLSADIDKGAPQVGDEVIYQHRPGATPGDESVPRPADIKAEMLDLDRPLPALP